MSFRDSLKIRSQADVEAERQRVEEEKQREHWLAIETARKTREVYEVKGISSWMLVGPFLGLLAAAIAGLMIWLSGNEGNTEWLWWIVGIGIAPLCLFGITDDLDKEWKASVTAKREVEEKRHTSHTDFGPDSLTLNGFEYQFDHLYTDSPLRYWTYEIARFILGLSTIVFAAVAAVLLFTWLGTISIAPTTIIIILLVLILLKK